MFLNLFFPIFSLLQLIFKVIPSRLSNSHQNNLVVKEDYRQELGWTVPLTLLPFIFTSLPPHIVYFNWSASQSTQMVHFTPAVNESMQVYSLWSRWPTAWSSTHPPSFTLWPDKNFPRPKQNANSTLLRFGVLQSKHQNTFSNGDTRAKLTFDTKQSALGSRSHQRSARFPRSMSTIKGV